MSNTRNRARFNEKFALLTLYAKMNGISFIVFTYTRTAGEQNELYKQGRTKPGKIVTDCDGYVKESFHQKDRARDLVIINLDATPVWDHVPEYDLLGNFWESLGGVWGGRWSFNDIYHFEY